MSSPSSALPYHEPGIVTILIISSFLILLNLINHVLDRIVYCGLVGQIFIGIAWGTPGAKWLSEDLEQAAVSLGYLGLILIVYRGGLSTNLASIKANLPLSALVAAVGISCPIALSFTLKKLLNATSLQAFAAGAALCSTSLGTTFTVLSTAGLTESRLGIVLSSAAMTDDVVGLVMVQVISNLGAGETEVDPVTVVRPVLVSIAFAVVVPLICRFGVQPLTVRHFSLKGGKQDTKMVQFLSPRGAFFIYQFGLVLAMITGASYAGTSNLYAAYLAGAVVTWWSDLRTEMTTKIRMPIPTESPVEGPSSDQERPQLPANSTSSPPEAIQPTATKRTQPDAPTLQEPPSSAAPTVDEYSGTSIYDQYLAQTVDYVLRPMFFASIGFSIPIGSMFSSGVVWRGIVYSVLMMIGKLFCGLCLIRFRGWSFPTRLSLFDSSVRRLLERIMGKGKKATPMAKMKMKKRSPNTPATTLSLRPTCTSTSRHPPHPHPHAHQLQPLSLYPSAILGSAMVARGEIGFLISSIAQAQGVFKQRNQHGPQLLFLVVNWAILLCTIAGPLAVGLLVKRVRRLQRERDGMARTGREDPLGVWGVVK